MPLTVLAIEGTALTGKTTLAHAIAAARGAAPTLVVPCYMEMLAPGEAPPSVAAGREQQLAATRMFVRVEARRAARVAVLTEADDGLVILDRSVDTIAAHPAGTSRMLGEDTGYAEAVELVAGAREKVIPDVTVLLDVPPAVLARRARTRPGFPTVYYDTRFVDGFMAHFASDRVFTRRVVPLDAQRDPAALRQHAIDIVEEASRA
ncbi:MAG TPA: hypothetical protein VM307_10825 [Egibacteraceae bacterium]|nr:hypothetical protein [Egibacteraceae bacterium]